MILYSNLVHTLLCIWKRKYSKVKMLQTYAEMVVLSIVVCIYVYRALALSHTVQEYNPITPYSNVIGYFSFHRRFTFYRYYYYSCTTGAFYLRHLIHIYYLFKLFTVSFSQLFIWKNNEITRAVTNINRIRLDFMFEFQRLSLQLYL